MEKHKQTLLCSSLPTAEDAEIQIVKQSGYLEATNALFINLCAYKNFFYLKKSLFSGL